MPQRDTWIRTIIDTIVDGVVIVDAAGSILVFNPGAERIFGYDAARVLGQNVGILFLRSGVVGGTAFWALSGNNVPVDAKIPPIQGRRSDGTWFPIYLSVGQIPGETDDGARYVGVIHDATREIEASEKLLETAARLRTIIESVPDALIVIDDRGLIDSFSPFAERLFGWSSAEVAGCNVNILMPDPYHSRHHTYMERYLRTGERRIIGIGRIVVGKRRDGTTFPMELAVAEVQLGGSRHFTGFVQDLTERQRSEKRVQDLQGELLHVSRLSAMGQMAAALAHELNQPLTAVANYAAAAERLLENHAGVPTKALEFIAKAGTQAERAGQIIRRLRRFVERGEVQHRAEALANVLEEGVALALIGARDSGMRVTLDIDTDLPPVWIDKVQIQQVVMNLVRNAVEAMQGWENPALTVAAAPAPDGTIAVMIADNGPGLAPEVASQLFQPFVSTKAQGMGVGLSICRTIIDGHHGRIEAEPNPGGGTRFKFYLRTAAAEAEISENHGDRTRAG